MAADVDGDGDLDAVSGDAGGRVAWHEDVAGDGATWSLHTIATLAGGADSVFAADVDGDGAVDVLAAGTDHVVWYENSSGDGSAWSGHTIASSHSFDRSVLGADVDGDGDADVLSLSPSPGTITWYQNTAGDGSAWLAQTVASGLASPGSIDVADVDRDGDVDVIATLEGDETIAWYENTTGDGSAWAGHTIATAVEAVRLAVAADVDGDGDIDAFSASGAMGEFFWHENTQGDGSAWTDHPIAPDGFDSLSLISADLDGDGDLDGVSGGSGGSLFWFDNAQGDGSTWTTRPVVDLNSYPFDSIFAADLGGDGDLDLLATGFAEGADSRIDALVNATIHRSAAFGSAVVVSDVADLARDIAVADLDGDGDLDAVSASEGDDKIAWYENGLGFAIHTITTAADGARSVFTADVDEDGDVDVLSASYEDDEIAWYENDGAGGTWTLHTISTAADGARAVFAADLDGDGDLDTLSASILDDTVAWYENDGSGGTWTPHTISASAGEPLSVFAADLDGDGDLDALSGSFLDAEVTWYENDGAAGTWTPHTIFNGAGPATSVVAADLDGDGDLDVLTAVDDNVLWHENLVSVGQVWEVEAITTSADGAASVVAADVDSDGDLDVVSASFGDDQVAWYENDGSGGGWTPHTDLVPADGAFAVAVGDRDEDGDLDVLSASLFDDSILWHTNVGGQFALPTADVAQKVVGGSEVHDLLEVEVVHRGRAGDTDVELGSLALFLDDGSNTPLTTAEANALFQELRVHVDDGSGSFEPGLDTLVATVVDLSLVDGVQDIAFDDGDPEVRVAHGAPKAFFVVAEMTSDAESQSLGTFQVRRAVAGPSTANDADHEIPLILEFGGFASTGTISTALTSASCTAPSELELKDRTVDDTLICEAGTRIRAGSSFVVVAPGDVTFRAGEGVSLEDGTAVQSGALRVEVDPDLKP